VDPIATFAKQLVDCGVLNEAGVAAVEARVRERNARAARRAAAAADPDPKDVIKYMYTDTCVDVVPSPYRKGRVIHEPPPIKKTGGEITYRDAIKEALIEERKRDTRVILYGEDVAEPTSPLRRARAYPRMNSSTLSCATSSEYCSGGDFMK
jgi:2-oxoisovalerate dehydrogenase E1 component